MPKLYCTVAISSNRIDTWMLSNLPIYPLFIHPIFIFFDFKITVEKKKEARYY